MNNKTICQLALALTGLSLMGSTYAANTDTITKTGFTNGQLYAGLQAGYGDVSTKTEDGVASTDLDPSTSGLAYRLSLGYLFPLSSSLFTGLELGYEGYPSKTINTSVPVTIPEAPYPYTANLSTKISTSSLDLLGVFKYAFNPKLYAFAKLGLGQISQKVSGSVSLTSTAEGALPTESSYENTSSLSSFKFALGGGYKFTKDLSAEISYSNILSSTYTPAPDILNDQPANVKVSTNTVMLGINYFF